jgi:hypothetical protein
MDVFFLLRVNIAIGILWKTKAIGFRQLEELAQISVEIYNQFRG